jgi:hypothetical protein
MGRPIALSVKCDLVLARRQMEPLKDAVVVIHDARIVAVDINLRLSRAHLETDGTPVIDRVRIAVTVRILIGEPRVAEAIPRIPEPEPEARVAVPKRVVVIATADYDHRPRNTLSHLGFGGRSQPCGENSDQDGEYQKTILESHGTPRMAVRT